MFPKKIHASTEERVRFINVSGCSAAARDSAGGSMSA